MTAKDINYNCKHNPLGQILENANVSITVVGETSFLFRLPQVIDTDTASYGTSTYVYLTGTPSTAKTQGESAPDEEVAPGHVPGWNSIVTSTTFRHPPSGKRANFSAAQKKRPLLASPRFLCSLGLEGQNGDESWLL